MSHFLSAALLCDFYKLSHREQYPKGTDLVYSTWTARSSRRPEITHVVWFGLQAALKKIHTIFDENFFGAPWHGVELEYKRIIKHALGIDNPNTAHLKALHEYGRLPIHIKALDEGSLVPIRVPMMTICNTKPEFFWVTNYLETLLSCELWLPTTSATLAHQYRKLLDHYCKETGADTLFVPFQGHDFSMRGLSSLESAISSGMGHLLSFIGTDTIPAIQAAEYYYQANVEMGLVGTSIPATEHSVQCAYGDDLAYFNSVLDVYPSGLVSIVSDGYDFWKVLTEVLPAMKGRILARNGKVVIRPDSGDPVKIVCGDPENSTDPRVHSGAVEVLWDLFGGTINAKGYKELDSHLGLIYGDAITLERAKEILEKLKAKGFASSNIVFGIGSFTYQYVTRDTFGFAMKSTLCSINGVEKAIFKDPKTDDGVKKSLKGRVMVFLDDAADFGAVDGLPFTKEHESDQLCTIYKDGSFHKTHNFADIRLRLASGGIDP